jgi:hypothetical protein
MAGGEGNNCNKERAVTDLPEPDSPTKARISPRLRFNEIFFTADTFSFSEIKSMQRFCMFSNGCRL